MGGGGERSRLEDLEDGVLVGSGSGSGSGAGAGVGAGSGIDEESRSRRGSSVDREKEKMKETEKRTLWFGDLVSCRGSFFFFDLLLKY